ncbi:MAG TPA: hypothetical protein VG733_06590 [Chthoniobacteraceae bacterium]|nr:hypothetical protein [Chthoniobacteraceae bacterium]
MSNDTGSKMATGDHYRVRAAELNALAKRELNPKIRRDYESLALSYLRLANQAERNSTTDVVYETPPSQRAGCGQNHDCGQDHDQS